MISQGLSYDGRRGAANPNEGGGGGGGKRVSARNVSARMAKRTRLQGMRGKKIEETPVFKKGKQKPNRPPRFMHRPIPSKLSHRSTQLHVCHRLAAPSLDTLNDGSMTTRPRTNIGK
jgi:hypothetical protein